MLIIANFSEESLTLPNDIVIDIAQEIPENLVVPMRSDKEIDVRRDHTFLAREDKKTPAKFKAYVRDKLAHVISKQKGHGTSIIQINARLSWRRAE
jgi:hypothetical protein